MNRKIFSFIVACFLLAAVDGSTQTITVTDELTREPVSNAVITSRLPAPNIKLWSATTNGKGQADITHIAGEDSLYIRHTNYGTQGFAMAGVKKNGYQVRLRGRSHLLDEVVFSANKTAESREDIPYTIGVVTDKDVALANPQTSADMLMNTGQVFVQKSQAGGGSPVLRGFEANKVLIVVDGVRMNNAIYRAGHLQDAVTIDPNMLERTEVLFGPSSVIYGSDALGGTMHFYSRRPKLSSDTGIFVASNAMLRASSANNELSAHFDINFGGNKWASLTSVTRSDFGDLRMGANSNDPANGSLWWNTLYVERINGVDSVLRNPDPLVQRHTGYSQIDLMQKFLFIPNGKLSHLVNFQLSTSSDIPRYDRLALIDDATGLPVYAEWSYGPQRRILASYTLTLYGDSAFYDKATVIASFQKIDQDRITRRLGSSKRKRQEEDVMVYALNADFTKELRGKHELRYGMEVTYNDVQSSATSTNINTEAITAADTRYPDGGSWMMTTALYISHSWEISDKLIFSDGLRLSYIGLQSNWNDTTFFPFPFREVKQSNVAPSGNVGLVWMPLRQWRFRLIGSSGFRAPNVDDIGKVFDSQVGKLIIPNPNLEPEIAYGGELGAEWTFTPGARLEATGFYSLLSNAIVIRNSTLNGADSVLYDGTMSQVQSAQNADRAYIYGFTTGMVADMSEHFSFRGSVTYTYGRYVDTENDTIVPLDHIPPVFGQSGLVFRAKGLEAELFVRYNGWKRLADYSSSGEDNLPQATPYGMPSWTTVNFRGAWHINKNVGVNFAVENIMDLKYRHFASGVSAPGRNYILAVRIHF